MAIKFSELKPLMKETSIQTVKMSDPVYGMYMECMTHYEEDNMIFETKKNITFKNINNLKNKNRLYEVYHFAPLSFRLLLHGSTTDWNNIQIQLNKKGLINIINAGINPNSLNKFYSESKYPRLYNNIKYMIECIQTNDVNTVFKNCFLFLATDIFWHQNTLDTMPILQWYGGKWNNMGIKNTFTINENYMWKVRYYNEYTDRDENIKSGVILYTSRFNTKAFFNTELNFIFMATDKIKQRYIPTKIRYQASFYKQNSIRLIGEENYDNLEGNVYFDLANNNDYQIYPYKGSYSHVKEV